MKQTEPIRFWRVRLWIVIFLPVLLILVSILQDYIPKRPPQIVHALGPSTLDVKVSWIIQRVFIEATSDENGIIYAMLISQDSLVAIDSSNGVIIWEIELPFERSGARDLLTNHDTVFVATSTSMDAYETSTGELKWSTRLGDGHKEIISQLDANILIVYYGDSQIKIDSETGEIVNTKPIGRYPWVLDNIILQPITYNQWKAIDRKTGEMVWDYPPGEFYLDEGREPKDAGNGKLIVNSGDGICFLNLQTGVFEWCHPEIYISNIAIDTEDQVGFGMRDDYVLLAIDLQTGAVLGETSFLTSGPIDKQLNYPSSIIYCDGVVTISFIDSEQTFGLEFKDVR